MPWSGFKRKNVNRKEKEKALTRQEAEAIKQAIQEAEQKTSAEIRVVVEKHLDGDPYQKAVEFFEKLGMTKTQQRNGVLIYVARESRKFAIIGDEGIHQHVGDVFWQEVAQEMKTLFQQGQFVEGIKAGVRRVGEVLSKYFPWQEGDINELSDEVVY